MFCPSVWINSSFSYCFSPFLSSRISISSGCRVVVPLHSFLPFLLTLFFLLLFPTLFNKNCFFYYIQLKGTFFERITAQFEVSLYFYTKLINLSVRQEWTRRKLFLITNFFKKIFNIQIPQVNGFKYYIFAFSYTN